MPRGGEEKDWGPRLTAEPTPLLHLPEPLLSPPQTQTLSPAPFPQLLVSAEFKESVFDPKMGYGILISRWGQASQTPLAWWPYLPR